MDSTFTPHLRAFPAPDGGQPTAYDAVKRSSAPAARLRLQRARRPRGRSRSTASCSGTGAATAAVLRRDGADAAHVGHPRSRGGRLLARLSTRTPASSASATSTPTRGSRSRSPASAGSRSTPRRPCTGRVAVERARHGAPPPRTRRGSAPRRRRPSAAAIRPARQRRGRRASPLLVGLIVVLLAASRAHRARPRSAGCGGRPRAVADAPLAELRRRSTGSTRRCPPRPRCSAWSGGSRSAAGPASGGLRRGVARAPLRPSHPGGADLADRRDVRRELARQRRRPPGGLVTLPQVGPRIVGITSPGSAVRALFSDSSCLSTLGHMNTPIANVLSGLLGGLVVLVIARS